MATFPTLSTGSVAMYPLTRNVCFATGIFTFINGSEQRVPDRAGYPSFALVLTGANGYDASLVREFFYGRKGAFDNTWSLTLAPNLGGSPVTYPNLFFADDAIQFTDAPAERFSVTLRCMQTP
jgi:hypothetical protein